MAPLEKRHDHTKVCAPLIIVFVVVPSILILSWYLIGRAVRRRPQNRGQVIGGGGRLTGGPWTGTSPRELDGFGRSGGTNPGRPPRPVRSSSGRHGPGPASTGRPSSRGRPPSRAPSRSRPGHSRDRERDGFPPDSMHKGGSRPSPRT